MNTKAVQINKDTEIGVVEHEGKTFVSLGFTRTKNELIAYLNKDNKLTTWGGEPIGIYRIISTWPIKSCLSSTMSQVEATLLDGSKWTGRSLGIGMIYRARPKHCAIRNR